MSDTTQATESRAGRLAAKIEATAARLDDLLATHGGRASDDYQRALADMHRLEAAAKKERV
jgi:uncharacterized protein YukE